MNFANWRFGEEVLVRAWQVAVMGRALSPVPVQSPATGVSLLLATAAP